MKPTQKIAYSALLTAAALMLSYIESLFPLPTASFGLKLGLANICVIFALVKLGAGYAAAISAVRVIISSMLFGSAVSFIYSAAGALLSLAVMIAISKTGMFSTASLSICGALSHNIAQIAAAALITGTAAIVSYLPVLIAGGIAAGIATGAVAAVLIARIPLPSGTAAGTDNKKSGKSRNDEDENTGVGGTAEKK